MLKYARSTVLIILSLLLVTQVIPLGNTEAKSGQFVTANAESSDPMLIMKYASDQLSGNLLTNWSKWNKGYTTETVNGPKGNQVTSYKAVAGEREQAGMYQTFDNIQPGTYVLSGWSRSQNVVRTVAGEYFSYVLAAYISYQDGSTKWYHTSFSYGTHDWEFRDVSFTVQRPARRMVIYAFLRSPAKGTAWFYDIQLKKGNESTTSTFHNLPVQVLKTAPGQETKKTLKTKDGLEIGLGDSVITSLKVDGDELANDSYSGFLVRDVAQTEKGIYAFAPASGSKPEAFKGTQSALGLSLTSDFKAKDNHIAVSGMIKDTTSDSEGRAVALSYALPVTASGWKWGVDIQSYRKIEGNGPGAVYKELGDEISVYDWDAVPRTYYPVGLIYNEDLGLAIAASQDFPQYYDLEYNASTNQYVITFHLGIVPEAPDSARFSFVIYKLDRPKWGYREAWDKYTRIFPEYFVVREKEQGLWVAWTDITRIRNHKDFNLKFKEESHYRAQGFFEMENNIKGYKYVELGDAFLANTPFDEAIILKALQDLASQDKSNEKTRQAIAMERCVGRDPFGNWNMFPVDVEWARNGVQFVVNANPRLPGEYNFYNLYFNDESFEILFDPMKAVSTAFDGIYLDELYGDWLYNGNFSKEHFKYTTVPLTYSPYYKKPMLHRASTTWEAVNQLYKDLDKLGKTLFANKCPSKYAFFTPLNDVMGTEQTALNGTSYAPQSIKALSEWRMLSDEKPFCILFSNDFDIFDREMMDKYIQRCLAFGIFPSPQASFSDNLQYWTSRKLYYERDRDLWKKYMPPLKRIAEAGWEAVTLAVSDNANVLVERFGESAAEGVYFTVYNTTESSQVVNVQIPLNELALESGATFRELISGTPIELQDGVYTTELNPAQVIVIGINNPQRPGTSTTTATTSTGKKTGPGGSVDVPTGENRTQSIFAGLLALAALLPILYCTNKKLRIGGNSR